MKALGDPYLKFCSCEQRGQKQRLIWFSGEAVSLRRQVTRCLRHQNLRDGPNLRISLKNKRVHPISVYQNNTENTEIQTVDSEHPKSVRVRFKLQRECAFGDQFLVVGNDPVLGLWEPSHGLALNWSEDHVWLGEVDLPSGRSINYKFILKSKTGTIMWQMGPDHVLETWDTDKVITVLDDWDSPQLQNILEEDPLAIVNEEQPSNYNGYTNPSIALVADDVVEDWGSQGLSSSSGDEGNVMLGENDNYHENGVSVRADDNDDLLRSEDDEKVPVLVPGLEPLPEEIESAEFEENKVEEIAVTLKIVYDEKIDDSSKPELKDENGPARSIEEKRNDDEQEQPQENSIVEADMQWGRRTLQKFLANLGFR